MLCSLVFRLKGFLKLKTLNVYTRNSLTVIKILGSDLLHVHVYMPSFRKFVKEGEVVIIIVRVIVLCLYCMVNVY